MTDAIHSCSHFCERPACIKRQRDELRKLAFETMLTLLDGAYTIIEIWKPESPSQIKWREDWLADARAVGVKP